MKPRIISLVDRLLDAAGLAGVRVVAQLLQFLLFLYAARILSTADFGLFSLAFAVTAGMTVLAEAGWREYAICHDDPAVDARLNAMSLLSGSVLGGMMLTGALGVWTSGMAGSPVERTFAGMLAMLAVWVWLRPLAMVQVGILTRRGQLRSLAGLQLAAECGAFLAGVAALASGWGLMSLALGKIALILVELGGASLLARSFRFHWSDADSRKDILSFARGMLGARIIQFVQGNYATLVVGLVYNPAAVGLYRAGVRLSGTAQEVIREPAKFIGWSSLRAAHAEDVNGHSLDVAAIRFFATTFALAAPLLSALAICAEPVVRVLLGAKWAESAPLLALLAVAAILRLIMAVFEPVMALRGKPERVRQIASWGFLIAALCFVAALPFGLEAVALSELAAAALILPVTLKWLERDGGIALRPLLFAVAPTMLGCALFAVVMMLVRWESGYPAWPPILQIAVAMAVLSVIQAATLLLFHRVQSRAPFLKTKDLPT